MQMVRFVSHRTIIALSKLVNGNTTPSPDELAKVSALGKLNRDVAETIPEQATTANVEWAMMLRRLLLTGYQEPHVFAIAQWRRRLRLPKEIFHILLDRKAANWG